MNTKHTGVLFFLALLSSCGPADAPSAATGDGSQEPSAAVAQELTECSSPTAAATTLAWASGAGDAQKVCASPFEYRLSCYTEKRSPACAVETPKTCYAAPCEHPDFGLEFRKTVVKTAHVQPDKVEEEICDPELQPPCHTYTVNDFVTPCTKKAQGFKNAVDPRYSGPITFTISVNPGVQQNCSVTLFQYPDYNSGTGPQCNNGYDCSIYHLCRHSSHGLSPLTCVPEWRYTAPGKSLADAKTKAQAEWSALQTHVKNKDPISYTQEPRCLSCQDKGFSGSAQVQSTFDCLDAMRVAVPSYSGYVDTAALDKEVVSRMKLAFELEGNSLTSTARTTAQSLYVTSPSHGSPCAATFSPPSCSGPGWGNLSALNASMGLCKTLLRSHVSEASLRASLDFCLGLAQQIAPLSEPSCATAQSYRELYTGLWLDLFLKLDGSMSRVGTFDAPSKNSVRKALGDIDRWYDATRNTLYAGSPAPKQLWNDLGRTFDGFWHAVYAGGLVSADETTLEADPLNTGLATDAAVLLAALDLSSGAPVPLDGPPLLMLLGDALRGTHERLSDFSQLHDLGCRFKGCSGGSTHTQVSELWNLLGSVPDAAALNAAILDAPKLGASTTEPRASWFNVFKALHKNHAVFRAAVEQTGSGPYTPGSVLGKAAAEVSPPLLGVSQVTKDAAARSASYLKTGEFSTIARNSLRIGIQEAKRTQLDQTISSRKGDLTIAVNDYITNRNAYINARLEELRNNTKQGTIEGQLELLLQQFNNTMSDLTGLRENMAFEDAAYGDFARTFNQAIEGEQENLAQMAFARDPPHSLSISAAEARFTPGTPKSNLSDFAVRKGGTPWVLRAGAGDLVNINVQGQWAPGCALSKANLRVPLGAGPDDYDTPAPGTRNALTGPEGYLVSYSNGSFTAESNSTSTHASASASFRACAGLKTDIGTGWNFGIKAQTSVYAYAEACVGGEVGASTGAESNNGSEKRSSATFATGIRLPGTPFDDLPAGSLLAIQVDRGSGAIIDRSVVLAPYAAITIAGDSGKQPGAGGGVDLYLVANDTNLPGCEPADTAHALTVSVQRMQSAGTAAKALSAAMASTLEAIRAATDRYVKQGRILSGEVSAERDAANAKLEAACGMCNLATFPSPLMALYNTFVSKELARLERAVEISVVERAASLKSLEMRVLTDEFDASGEQGRMLSLVPAWSLRNLDGQKLRIAARGLGELAGDYLYPVLDLRYPWVLPQLSSATELNSLVQADWTLPYVDLADLAVDAVDRIETALAQGRLDDPNPYYTNVVLSIPKPGATVVSQWPQVSAERAKAVWTSLQRGDADGKARFHLEVLPEDLYAAQAATAGMLQCTEGSPVLHRLALFFALPSANTTSAPTLNAAYLRSETEFGSSLRFPGEHGIKTYVMEDSQAQSIVWRKGQSRLLFGLADDALGILQAQELSLPEVAQVSTGDGLSPFNAMTFDVSGLRNRAEAPLANANELLVLMKVDRRAVATMPQPLACQ